MRLTAILPLGMMLLAACSGRAPTEYEQGYMQGYVNSLAIQQIYDATQPQDDGVRWNRPYPGTQPLPPVQIYQVPQPNYPSLLDSYKAPGYQVPPFQAPIVTRDFAQQRRKPCSINNPC